MGVGNSYVAMTMIIRHSFGRMETVRDA